MGRALTAAEIRNHKKQVYSWALYDWANSAFATTVMSGFFPVFFKKYWSAGVDATTSTFYLGTANSIASLALVAVAPFLGAIADRGQNRKKFLFAFAALGVFMTAGLYLVSQGQWQLAVFIYALAMLGFAGANIFYDSLISLLSDDGHELDRISSLGFSLGYLGGGLLFAINVFMTVKPEFFGIVDSTRAVQISFLMVAIWWAVFSLPLLFNLKESTSTRTVISVSRAVKQGFSDLINTCQEIRKLRETFYFLIAYWLYIDGVDTIIKMAVDYGMSLGFQSNDLIVALLIVQFVGFPSALVFGWFARKTGTKNGILFAIGVYIGVTFWGYRMNEVWEFYALAVAIGMVQGGIQALSRSLFARMIPEGRSAQFFGFYNMMGKFAAVIGPLLMGLVAYITKDSRSSLLSINLLFVLGAYMLLKVDVNKAQKAAAQFKS